MARPYQDFFVGRSIFEEVANFSSNVMFGVFFLVGITIPIYYETIVQQNGNPAKVRSFFQIALNWLCFQYGRTWFVGSFHGRPI